MYYLVHAPVTPLVLNVLIMIQKWQYNKLYSVFTCASRLLYYCTAHVVSILDTLAKMFSSAIMNIIIIHLHNSSFVLSFFYQSGI